MSEHTLVKFPQMGEGVHEATLIKWFKKPGEKVEKDEPLLEVATDKVDTEIVAPSSGFLIATFAGAGEVISVQQTLAQISLDPKDTPVQVSNIKNASHDAHTRQSGVRERTAHQTPVLNRNTLTRSYEAPRSFAGPIRSSPLVRKLAKENGVNLADLKGSGLHGRITKDDLYFFLNETVSKISSAPTGFHLEENLFAQNIEKRGDKEFLDGVEVQRVQMSRIRKITAEHMLRSVRVSPHVTTTFEIDFSEVMRAKKIMEKNFLKGKLSYTAFLIHASVQAIKEHPIVNASVDGDDILMKERINIGCAVATDHGLIVPVLKDMNHASLFEIAELLNNTVVRAREKRLNPEDVQGGTFSITNPGIYGSLHSQPIISQPQVAILSVGAIVERPVVYKGEIVVRPLVQVGLTFDHRVIDGEGGAKFLASLKGYLETYKAL